MMYNPCICVCPNVLPNTIFSAIATLQVAKLRNTTVVAIATCGKAFKLAIICKDKKKRNKKNKWNNSMNYFRKVKNDVRKISF